MKTFLRENLVTRATVWVILFAGFFIIVGCDSSTDIGVVPIEISDTTVDVTIKIDGEIVEVTGLRQRFEFSTGMHELAVTGTEIEPISKSFEVVPGRNPVLKIDLRRQSTTAAAEVDPQETSDQADSTSKNSESVAENSEPQEPVVEPVATSDSITESVPIEVLKTAGVLTPREQDVVQWVKSVGGDVQVAKTLLIQLPPEAQFTDDDFNRFQDLPNLKVLICTGGSPIGVVGRHVSDRAILQLRDLPKLKMVSFSGPGLTDRSMEHLASFKVDTITLCVTNVSDEGLAHFSSRKISGLFLKTCPNVTDAGLTKLDLSECEIVRLMDIGATNRFIATLSDCRMLKRLHISTRINGNGLKSIESLTSIVEFVYEGAPLQDSHLYYLRGNRQLDLLHLKTSSITGRGVRFIAATFPQLTDLELLETKITRNDVVDWSTLPKLTRLSLRRNPIGSRQLRSLASLSNLRNLEITNSRKFLFASDEDLLAFGNALPRCKINGLTAQQFIAQRP